MNISESVQSEQHSSDALNQLICRQVLHYVKTKENHRITSTDGKSHLGFTLQPNSKLQVRNIHGGTLNRKFYSS